MLCLIVNAVQESSDEDKQAHEWSFGINSGLVKLLQNYPSGCRSWSPENISGMERRMTMSIGVHLSFSKVVVLFSVK
jgi:hypothetical protein